MPVAEVPGDPDQMSRVVGGNLHQVFRFRQNLYDPAVFQFKPVAMAQQNGARLVQKEAEAPFSGQDRPAPVTVFPVKRDPVCGVALQVFRPRARGMDFPNADHDVAVAVAIADRKAGRSLRRVK